MIKYCKIDSDIRRLTKNYFDKLKEKMDERLKKLYVEKDATFRGFRPV